MNLKNDKLIKTFKDYKNWQLVLILLLLSFVVMTLLRLNNTGMVSRREAVRSADQEDNLESLKNRLADLQVYVNSHMNTSTGRFFLEGQYRRDSEVIIEKAKKAANNNPHGNIYRKVSEVCDPKFTYYSAPYFQCYMNELAKYPAAEYGPTEVKLPNPNAYQVEYTSPGWTPDFAGFSMLFWFITFVTVSIRFVGKMILLLLLQKYKKRI